MISKRNTDKKGSFLERYGKLLARNVSVRFWGLGSVYRDNVLWIKVGYHTLSLVTEGILLKGWSLLAEERCSLSALRCVKNPQCFNGYEWQHNYVWIPRSSPVIWRHLHLSEKKNFEMGQYTTKLNYAPGWLWPKSGNVNRRYRIRFFRFAVLTVLWFVRWRKLTQWFSYRRVQFNKDFTSSSGYTCVDEKQFNHCFRFYSGAKESLVLTEF